MNCYYCAKPAQADGSTFHHPNCAGLERSDLNNLQVHDLEVIKRRYDDMMRDLVGARHLLALLSPGKGTVEDFGKMMDRIHVSREYEQLTGERNALRATCDALAGAFAHQAEGMATIWQAAWDKLVAERDALAAEVAAKNRIIDRHVKWRNKTLMLLGTCPLTPEIKEFIDGSTLRVIQNGDPP